MKRLTSSMIAGFVALMMLAAAVASFADDAQTITVTGMGKCAKCALHQSDKCQNVVEVEKDGKTTTYWLTGEKSKDFHKDNLCQDSKKVTVTGTVSEKDGKQMIEVSEIKLAD